MEKHFIFIFRNSYIDSATLYTPKTFTNIFFHNCDEKNRIYNQQMMVIIKKGVGDKIQKCEKKEKMAQHIHFLYTGTVYAKIQINLMKFRLKIDKSTWQLTKIE